MNNRQIKALITLLEDEDQEVVAHVKQQIIDLGTPIIPFLEEEWESKFNPVLQERIEDLIHFLQFELVKERLKRWKDTEYEDLIKGLWILITYQYPDFEQTELTKKLDQLYYEVWRNFSDDLAPFDQIRTINSILFEKIKFRGNTKNFHSPANSMLHLVLESKRGNPISLCTVYLYIAQRLKLPVFGVNLPNLFVLTYKTENLQFYINAFNRGLIFSKEETDQYLHQLQISPRPEYYEPCSALDIVIRYLRNLIVSFEKVGEYHKSDEVKQLLQIVDLGFKPDPR